MSLEEFSGKMIVVFALGLAIAAEQAITNTNKKSAFTFSAYSLLAGLGGFSGMLTFAYPMVGLVLIAAVLLAVIGLLIVDLKEQPNASQVFSAFFSFMIGFFSFMNLVPVTALIGITAFVVVQNILTKFVAKSASLLKKS